MIDGYVGLMHGPEHRLDAGEEQHSQRENESIGPKWENVLS